MFSSRALLFPNLFAVTGSGSFLEEGRKGVVCFFYFDARRKNLLRKGCFPLALFFFQTFLRRRGLVVSWRKSVRGGVFWGRTETVIPGVSVRVLFFGLFFLEAFAFIPECGQSFREGGEYPVQNSLQKGDAHAVVRDGNSRFCRRLQA